MQSAKISVALAVALVFAGCSKEGKKTGQQNMPIQGNWSVEANHDEFQRTVDVYGTVISQGGGAEFTVACEIELKYPTDKTFWISIKTDKFLGADKRRRFQYIIDLDAPATDMWKYKDYGLTLMAANKSDWDYKFNAQMIQKIIDRLQSAKTMKIRVYTFDYRTIDYEFEAAGFDDAYKDIGEKCKP
jgi:hypothetical protein